MLQVVCFASKAFGVYLSNALVEELRDTRVTVTDVMLTATATEFAVIAATDGTALFAIIATLRK